MSNFPYYRNIPAGPNNPSFDRPKMTVNTNSTDDLLNIDHFSFGVNLGGDHKQVTLPLSNGGTGSIPAGRIPNTGTLYTKTATSTGVLTESNLFYTPDASTNEYQLTKTITASYPLFGTKTVYQTTAIFNADGGWTFLPGGILLQYGSVVITAVQLTPAIVINFPVQFAAGTVPIFTLAERGRIPSTSIRYEYVENSVTNLSFSLQYAQGGSGTNIVNWTAIGF